MAQPKPLTNELSLIRSIRDRQQSASRRVRLGIGDDCALIRPAPGQEIAITTDFSLENVHFRRDWHPPESVGHRCLARGLSDLAAMGARPVAALLSIALPEELARAPGKTGSWFTRFLDGFLALAAVHKVQLIGGDTAQSPRQTVDNGLALADVVLLGAVKQGAALRRSGARAGDILYVTGALGGAAAELLALEKAPASFRALTSAGTGHPHLWPSPRVGVGLRLTALATAAIDLSDGVSTDLHHLCEESGLAAEICNLPIHALASAAENASTNNSASNLALGLALNLALNGGEDYELLFTASPRAKVPARIAGVPIHRIGVMKQASRGGPLVQMRIESVSGARDSSKLVPVEPRGWEHFRSF